MNKSQIKPGRIKCFDRAGNNAQWDKKQQRNKAGLIKTPVSRHPVFNLP